MIYSPRKKREREEKRNKKEKERNTRTDVRGKNLFSKPKIS
jgi:hypothetical protein